MSDQLNVQSQNNSDVGVDYKIWWLRVDLKMIVFRLDPAAFRSAIYVRISHGDMATTPIMFAEYCTIFSRYNL